MLKKFLTPFVLFSYLISYLISFSVQGKVLEAGTWKFELETTHSKIPFILEVMQNNKNFSATLLNGEEKIPLEIILHQSHISIPIQNFEISLELDYPEKGKMRGHLVRHNKNPKTQHKVTGIFGQKKRFEDHTDAPTIDLSGTWSVSLKDEKNSETKGALVLLQNQNKLTGSLLTPTGDYRYMEGIVFKNQFKLASFDGVYNYLFSGELKEEKLEAKLLNDHQLRIEGVKDSTAQLPDPYSQTVVKDFQFEFSDLSGKKISLKDIRFKNKPVIVQIFGSWCPNCLDEMKFLIPWYLENKHKRIEVVTLAFERSLDQDSARAQLQKTIKKYGIPYTVLLAGATSADTPKEKLPGVTNFISYPTTIFLDKNHQIFKVHTGFSGPSTGIYFDKWKKEFYKIISELEK